MQNCVYVLCLYSRLVSWVAVFNSSCLVTFVSLSALISPLFRQKGRGGWQMRKIWETQTLSGFFLLSNVHKNKTVLGGESLLPYAKQDISIIVQHLKFPISSSNSLAQWTCGSVRVFNKKYTVRNKKEVGIVYVRKWVNWGKTKWNPSLGPAIMVQAFRGKLRFRHGKKVWHGAEDFRWYCYVGGPCPAAADLSRVGRGGERRRKRESEVNTH